MAKCEKCNSNVLAYYVDPPVYVCSNRSCNQAYQDANHKGITVLTMEEAKSKRPLLYGLPQCECCPHAPHDGACAWCEKLKAPPDLIRLVPVENHVRRDRRE